MKTAMLVNACWYLLVFTFAGVMLTVEPQHACETSTPTRAERLWRLTGAASTFAGAIGVGWALRDDWRKE